MTTGQVLVGNTIKADDVQDELDKRSPLHVRKNADQNLTSANTTLQNDTELLLTVEAGKTYEGLAVVIYNAGVTGDIKFAWTFPTATLDYIAVGLDTAAAMAETVSVADVSGTAKPFGGVGLGSKRFVRYTMRLAVTVAGTLRLQAAQNTSTAEVEVVNLGSWLTLREVA